MKRKDRGARARRWLGALLVAGALLSLASLTVLYRGPWLRVAGVTVVGAQRVSPEAVELAMGLTGRSLLTLDEVAAARRVEALPWVRRAGVERRWPRQLLVTVDERQPLALWRKGGRSYLVDQEGVVLQEGSALGLWAVQDLDPGLLSPGDRVDAEALRLHQRLLASVPQELGAEVLAFEYLRRGGLKVVTSRGSARFGGEEDLVYKLAVWRASLEGAALQEVAVSHIDLRFGPRPFVR